MTRVSQDARWPKYQVREVLRSFGRILPLMVIERGRVTLFGFGTFLLTELHPMKTRNFATGEVIETTGKPWIKFKPGAQTRRTIARRRKRR